jgi:hypothetical protein
MRLRPLADPRKTGAERLLDHVLGIPDEDRAVAEPRVVARRARCSTRSWKTMKLVMRISSIRRHASKTSSSWPAASRVMCCDSFASSALAGWMRSPRASRIAVTGCWASIDYPADPGCLSVEDNFELSDDERLGLTPVSTSVSEKRMAPRPPTKPQIERAAPSRSRPLSDHNAQDLSITAA